MKRDNKERKEMVIPEPTMKRDNQERKEMVILELTNKRDGNSIPEPTKKTSFKTNK